MSLRILNFRFLIPASVALDLFAAGALAQNCRQGSVELDVSMRCACVKDPGSDSCKLYMRNKDMYDGKGLQLDPAMAAAMKNGPTPASPAPRTVQPAVQSTVQQQRTPVSAALLPAETPFWLMLPAGTRMAMGMRPQWLGTSPLLDQLLSLGGNVGGASPESIRKELAGVEMVIMASPRLGGPPLILARAVDVVRATKSERDPYRYVDPNTILVGDPNETNAAMRRLFGQETASAEAQMAARVASWSDVWMVMDLSALPAGRAQLPGATKMTLGMSLRDGMTVEAWLDTLSPLAAKNLAERLRKNPRGAPFFAQLDTPVTSVEQRDNAVRLYARAALPGTGSAGSGAAQQAVSGPAAAPVPAPAITRVSRDKVAEVKKGMDRAAVEAALGKPNSVVSIQGSDEAIETLIYNLEPKGTARVRTVSGNAQHAFPDFWKFRSRLELGGRAFRSIAGSPWFRLSAKVDLHLRYFPGIPIELVGH